MPSVHSRMAGSSRSVSDATRAANNAGYRKFSGRCYTLKNGTQIRLEDLYLVPQHPQRAGIRGRSFIYYQDTSREGLAATWTQEKLLETPKGNRAHITSLGYLQLDDGDAVFSRSLNGDQDPLKDVLQVWVADGRFWTTEMKTKLDEARDGVLGPRDERSRTRPAHPTDDAGNPVNDSLVGGSAYERSPIAKSVKPPARAFTCGPSLESPTSIMAPVASAKADASTGQLPAAVEHRTRLLEAIVPFAMGTMNQGPAEVVRMIHGRSELMNKPRIGAWDNWAYATKQLNLAPARNGTSNPEDSGELSKDLGFFGGAHIDKGDQAAWYSNMTSNHDIPDDYEDGMFFILQLGVFIVLKKYSSINFFGQRRHGGTPPLSPVGTVLYKFAYRFVVISYPPRRMVNGTARVTLAALPNREALIIPPEILHTGCACMLLFWIA
ncbi:hypothetical protein FB451DRAFT_1129741 [Mycena latifolia]|nr:hypothetical protein FB451DRAFT_1129741 [Mycena latifolia]